jgi:hypothetical protein
VLTCGQGDFGLGLAAAKMNVVEIARNRLIKRRQTGIDEKMMMTGIWLRGACRSDLHVLDPEMDRDLGGDRRTVLEIDKEYPGIRSRRPPRRNGLLRANLDARIQSNYGEDNQADAEKKSIHKLLPCHANMSHQGEQVAAADHRSEVPRLVAASHPQRPASRGCSLKTGHISDRLAELWA